MSKSDGCKNLSRSPMKKCSLQTRIRNSPILEMLFMKYVFGHSNLVFKLHYRRKVSVFFLPHNSSNFVFYRSTSLSRRCEVQNLSVRVRAIHNIVFKYWHSLCFDPRYNGLTYFSHFTYKYIVFNGKTCTFLFRNVDVFFVFNFCGDNYVKTSRFPGPPFALLAQQ